MDRYLKIGWMFLLLFVLQTVALCQTVDKKIDMGNYISYYCYSYKNPLYVTYTLKKGGGDCSRKGFHFVPYGNFTAVQSDYDYSHFEEGHMANAEDFAYDCALDKNTFNFLNCVPQTRKLNRGIWRTWEKNVRDMSQSKAVFVIAGAIYGEQMIKEGHKVRVPTYCYKIVIDPPTKNILLCKIFPNDESDSCRDISLAELKTLLHYPLMP